MTNATSPVVTMCETSSHHIITSANGRTYDLTALETPFGLLPEDVQEALRAWPHGWAYYTTCAGWENTYPHWGKCQTYRARPAPKVTEHVLWWCARSDATTYIGDCDTHKITMTHTGDTLPFGTYTGPDGATITVEKAE
jgi:hypothetical protein